jgi:hypothetical protein
MLDQKTARLLVMCGVAAAALGGLSAVYLSFMAGTFAGLPVAALSLGLAYGIYRQSRACAVLATILYLLERLGMYAEASAIQQVRGGSVVTGFWISVTLFTTLYALGIAGTFSSQAGASKPTRSAIPAPPDLAGGADQPQQPSERKPKRRRAAPVPAAHELCNVCAGTGKIRDTDLSCAWCNGAGYI